MEWYFVVLIVVGAHLALALLALLAVALGVDEDVVVWALFPIAMYCGKRRDERRRREWEREEALNKALKEKYHYVKPYIVKAECEGVRRAGVVGGKDYPACSNFVIYFEKIRSEGVNGYIGSHYDEICRRIESMNMTFVYLPEMWRHLDESVGYAYPGMEVSADVSGCGVDDLYDSVARTMGLVDLPLPNPAFLVPVLDHEEGLFRYVVLELNYENEEQFGHVMGLQLDAIGDRMDIPSRYMRVPASGDDFADSESIETLADEIRHRVNRLYAMGVTDDFVKALVALPRPDPSRLLIDQDFRIILPDYGDMEIAMPTLSKVLFLFYLNHPEGVLFKCLVDHREELFEIYRMLSPSEDMAVMAKRIDDLVDSTRNSVNEKCSRIKAAFVGRFVDSLAVNYYVTGNAGKPKRILLDRNLVVDKSSLMTMLSKYRN